MCLDTSRQMYVMVFVGDEATGKTKRWRRCTISVRHSARIAYKFSVCQPTNGGRLAKRSETCSRNAPARVTKILYLSIMQKYEEHVISHTALLYVE